MRCPACLFESQPEEEHCAGCGYDLIKVNSSPLARDSAALKLNVGVIQPSAPNKRLFAPHPNMLLHGRYRLMKTITLPLNQQYQGTAWLASDVHTVNSQVVVRELRLSHAAESSPEQSMQPIRQRLDEATRNTGTPNLLDTFKESDTYFFVFQHVEGNSLSAILQQYGGNLPDLTVAEYGRQICQVLALFANMRPPFIHGSVDPETIIISPDGNYASLTMIPLVMPRSVQTATGYLAPEQRRGTVVPSSDIYSLAATMHHALTGYDPRQSTTYFRLPARQLKSTVLPEMEAILSRAMRLMPEQRYAHPYDMHKALTALLAAHPQKESSHAPMAARLQRRSRQIVQNIVLAGVCALVVLSLAGASLLVAFTPNAAAQLAMQKAALQKDMVQEMQAYQRDKVGLSDGRFALNIYPSDNNSPGNHSAGEIDLKKQSALAIQQGKLHDAMTLLQQAITLDPTDAEARIYAEDTRIRLQNAPYVTLVLGLPINAELDDRLIDDAQLQAAFLEQRSINQHHTLPHNLQLRILVAGSGPADDGAITVARFIKQRVVDSGNPDHIIAVVGWPSDTDGIAPLNVFTTAHMSIPFLTQTSSVADVGANNPYFFRILPTDIVQSQDIAAVAVHDFNAKRILVFRDPNDAMIKATADNFSKVVTQQHGIVIKQTFTHKMDVDKYMPLLQAAFADNQQKPDFIFMAGDNHDAIHLAHAYGLLVQASPDIYPSTLRIMGTSDLNTSTMILGQPAKDSERPDASIAAANPQDMQRLVFPALTSQDEWGFEHFEQPPMLIDWHTAYQQNLAMPAPDPSSDALLTYDAIGVAMRAASLVREPLTGQAVHDSLAALGKGNVAAYQGVTGRIVFDTQGNPEDRAMMILSLEAEQKGDTTKNVMKTIQVVGKFS